MVKLHIKRISAPKTWPIKRKQRTFTIRGFPTGQKKELTLPITLIIRDLLDFAKTAKEVRYILKHKRVLLNGKKVTSHRKSASFMDIIFFPDLKKTYRLSLNKYNKVIVVEEQKNTDLKIIKLVSKKKIKNTKTQKNKIQLGFNDGTNILSDEKNCKEYNVNDSFLIKFDNIDKKRKIIIKEYIPFKEGNIIFIMGGKYVGNIGKLIEISNKNIIIEGEDKRKITTSKKHAIVIGTEKPLITLN